jgi:peptidoglycan L-alanyl-D-glutamate endopeptidase CwlK
MRDKLSEDRLLLLHPKVRDTFKKFIEECEAQNPEWTLRISQGLRTFAEQQALYDQGRTKPGKKVSNAKAGQSLHNYGLAIDLVELDDKVVDWNFDMKKLAPIAEKYGITCGSKFRSFPDLPHFEINFGKNWEHFFNLKKDKEGYVII